MTNMLLNIIHYNLDLRFSSHKLFHVVRQSFFSNARYSDYEHSFSLNGKCSGQICPLKETAT